MHVVRSEEQKYAWGRIKRFAVDEVYARSVGSCGEFPVAVAVNYRVFFPQKSVYLVGGEFGNKFFNFFLAHIIYVIRYIHESIITKLRHFVNRPIKNNKKTTGYDK